MNSFCVPQIRKCDCAGLIALITVLVFGARVIRAQNSPADLQMAKAGWADYRKSAATLQGDLDETFYKPDRQVKSRGRSSFHQKDACFSTLGQPIADKARLSKGVQRVQNESYYFELTRPNENGSWALVKVGEVAGPGRIEERLSARALVLRFVDKPITIAGSDLSLPELTDEADFYVRSISRTAAANGCVRLAFSMPARWLEPRVVNGIQVDKVWNGLRSGWIDLDPSLMWVVRAYDVDYQETHGRDYFVSGQINYDIDGTGPRIIKETMTSRKGAALDSEVISSLEWNYRLDRTVPPHSLFTLTHFGFPEPAWASGRRWPYHWALGGAAFCIVIGLIVRSRIRLKA